MSQDRLREFFWFITERQNVYKRRFIDEDGYPWTHNPVLRDYHFCNVYRRLDRGTKYALENILNQDDERDVFFNIILYRLVNRPGSFEAMGGFTPVEDFDVELAVHELHDYSHRASVFSPAYRIPAHRFADSDSKIDNVFYGIVDDDLREYFHEYWMGVHHADSMEIAHNVIKDIRGIGPFIAYEILTDLNYTILPFHENDFVNVGPGAKKGIDLIWDDVDDYEARIYWLVYNQDRLFDKYDLDFFRWNGEWEAKPTARTFEHALCEYSKFDRAKNKGGYVRRFDYDTQQTMDAY